MPRRGLLGLIVLTALTAAPSTSFGQAPYRSFDDPFFLYYGFYLPQAQANALRPRASDTPDQQIAARQRYALTNRSSLYDPNGSFTESEFGSGRGRSVGSIRGGSSGFSNTGGNGPALFYSRHSNYYPGLRTTRGPNRNVATPRRYNNLGSLGVPSFGPGSSGFDSLTPPGFGFP